MHATSSVVVDIVRLRVISVQNDCFLPEAERPRGAGGGGTRGRRAARGAWAACYFGQRTTVRTTHVLFNK